MTKPSTPDTDKTAAAPAAEPRDFAAFLMDVNKGRSHRELSAQLAELVAQVQSTGRPGSITYKVTVKPQKGNDYMVLVEDEIVAKPPKGERGASHFFIDDAHGLVRNDPRQETLY